MEITTYEDLAQHLIDNKMTMLWKDLFNLPIRNYSKIVDVDGDIVECGVWRGGCSIFLSHLFPNKTIWCCDSYEGFQPLEDATYKFKGERHTPNFTHGVKGPIAISLEEVKNNFEFYGIPCKQDSDRVKFLKGFVNQTLPTAPIEKISLLRLDVDSYSATLEILNILYDKVQSGGFIIFDDINLKESYQAIIDFLTKRSLPLELYHPSTDEKYRLDQGRIVNSDSGFPSNSYIIKK